MIKAMKKLKFWSRKKKKKKSLFFTEQEQQQRQPPTVCSSHYHHHCHYYPVEPSAPPLPSWLDNDDDQIQDPILASDKLNPTISATSSEAPPCTIKEDKTPQLLSPQNSTLQDEINAKSSSYQQYMAESPVYGVPVVPPQVTRERDAGAAGCVFSFGAHLFRCFFPCFHIREAS